MKKTIACIFAHPDDEAFGPGGTIAKLALDNDVYLICATRGEIGQNHFGKGDIAKIREKELLASTKELGVKQVFFLDYRDGELRNAIYHEMADKIIQILTKLKPSILLTWEHRGVSGHIDHITISMVASFVFYKLPFVKKIMYYCLLDKYARKDQDYFIYFPPGYKRSHIDEVIDTSSVWTKKVKAMEKYQSQKKDVERVIKQQTKQPKKEYFLIREK